MLEPVSFEPEDRILDMCCGTGGATFAILKKAGAQARITGMDLSWGQIRIAHKQREKHLSSATFIEGDVTKTCFRDGYFDKVFITHALHEMEREERLDTLREAKRILRAGGKLVILEVDDPKNPLVRLFIGFWFFYWLPFNFETPTRRDMLKRGVENEMKEIGFENIKKISSHRRILQVVEGQK